MWFLDNDMIFIKNYEFPKISNLDMIFDCYTPLGKKAASQIPINVSDDDVDKPTLQQYRSGN